ncbi:MAG: GatB/YqeY domain-containing protein [Candidatus Eremiobacteraeota bacterium]|nr:GatB/YqeY domain-containing protein [Candidatus Eremiobacteraeota bacterium]
MKARDQLRVDALRSALSGFIYKKTESGAAGELSEADETEVVRRQVKQRNDSIAEFTKAGRAELAQKETQERDILQMYLPQQKTADEIRSIVQTAVADIPVGERRQGAVMKAIMPHLRNSADGNLVRQIVAEELVVG